MRAIDKILAQLEACITQNKYEVIETDKVELKDFSGGVSAELYRSACAFLNAEGGMIIIGVHEKDRHYSFKGYNSQIENALKELPKQFRNQQDQLVDLALAFPAYEIRDFMGGKICVVYVEKLDEEQKYVFYKGEAYKRKITGDHKLSEAEIEAQNELRAELENVRELKTVAHATLETLDVDKLNDYIVRLNRDVRVETLKADIPSALSFLSRKAFVRVDKPTLLGMLVCGRNVEDYIGARCQVDGFVDSQIQIAGNKQVLKDNILALMERSVGFVYKNIQVGVSHVNSGTATPEYPEQLIRETINNALAHRDYGIDKFVNIIIKPNESIAIRNPGSFRQEQKLVLDDPEQRIRVRRIIPIAKARNPRLADVLKTFDRWEGRGIGMASLVNACLDNQIGVPYYIFHSEHDVSLFIPKGKCLDYKMEFWLEGFAGYLYKKNGNAHLSKQEQIVLSYFHQSELLNRIERYTILLTPDNNHFGVIAALEERGLIFRHQNSSPLYPVYMIDSVLRKTDFTEPLRKRFGKDYDNLKADYKDLLQVIYQSHQYGNHSTITASRAGAFWHRKKATSGSDVRPLEGLLRTTRNIFSSLERKGFIVRHEGKKPEFVLNEAYREMSARMNVQ